MPHVANSTIMKVGHVIKCLFGTLLVIVVIIIWNTQNENSPWKSADPKEHQKHRALGSDADMNELPSSESNYRCGDLICSEYLTQHELEDFEKCRNSTVAGSKKFGPIREGTCHFMKGDSTKPVALASYPGSGNTWLRGLLEKATGICTGALYCDRALRTSGFTGEGVKGSAVIAVKVHGKGGYFSNQKLPRRLEDKPVYGAAILLIRNPKDALIAEWHRERTKRQTNTTISNHNLYADKRYFGNNSDWNAYVHVKGTRWLAHIVGWLTSAVKNPLHIVRFEDLKSNMVEEMFRIINFLNVSYDSAIVRMKLKDNYVQFYRRHHDDFEHFTSSQEAFVKNLVNRTVAALRNVIGLPDSSIVPFLSYL